MAKKLVNGVRVEMTAQEIAGREADETRAAQQRQQAEAAVLAAKQRRQSAMNKLATSLGVTAEELKDAIEAAME